MTSGVPAPGTVQLQPDGRRYVWDGYQWHPIADPARPPRSRRATMAVLVGIGVVILGGALLVGLLPIRHHDVNCGNAYKENPWAAAGFMIPGASKDTDLALALEGLHKCGDARSERRTIVTVVALFGATLIVIGFFYGLATAPMKTTMPAD